MQLLILSRIGSRLAPAMPISALFFFLSIVASTSYAAIYKCAAKDGSTTYSDQPCDNKPEVVQVTPEPLHSTAETINVHLVAPSRSTCVVPMAEPGSWRCIVLCRDSEIRIVGRSARQRA